MEKLLTLQWKAKSELKRPLSNDERGLFYIT